MDLGTTLTRVELCFNVAGYSPVGSCVTGGFRAACGKAQVIGGVAMMILGAIVEGPTGGRLGKWGWQFLVHGVLNAGRGWVEFGSDALLTGAPTCGIAPVVGKCALIGYDFVCFLANKRLASYPCPSMAYT